MIIDSLKEMLLKNRKMPSNRFAYTNVVYSVESIDSKTQFHAQRLVSVLETTVCTVLYISILPMSSSYSPASDNSFLYKNHSKFIENVLEYDLSSHQTFVIFGTTLLFALLILEACSVILVVGANLRMWSKSHNRYYHMKKKLLEKLGSLIYIKLTFLLVPISVFCAGVIFSSVSIVLKMIAGLMLWVLPLEIALHNLITFDFRYVRINMLQGRDYRLFTIRCVGIFLLSLASVFNRKYKIEKVAIATNFLSLSFHSLLIFIQIRKEIFLGMETVKNCQLLGSVIVVAEIILRFIGFARGDVFNSMNVDYVVLVFIVGFFFSLKNASNIFSDSLMKNALNSSEYLIHKYLLTTEKIFDCYTNQSVNRKKIQLYSSLIAHIQNCQNPLCLCFTFITYLDSSSNKSIDTDRKSRELFYYMQRRNVLQGTVSQNDINNKGRFEELKPKISIFSIPLPIQKLKTHHSKIVTCAFDLSKDCVEVKERSREELKDTEYTLNLDNSCSFKMFLCSIMNKQLTDNFKNTFYFALAILRFKVFEYKNQVAAMIFGYDYLYSLLYKKESRFYADFLLSNIIKISKMKMSESNNTTGRNEKVTEEIENNPLHVDIGKALKFKLKSFEVRKKIQELTASKSRFYSMMSSYRIEFKKMVEEGSEVYLKIEQVRTDLQDLMQQSKVNAQVVRDMIIFEVFILEKGSIGQSLKVKYKEVIMNHRINGANSLSTQDSKYRFDPLKFQNVVVCLRSHLADFRIDYYSKNASGMLGTGQQEIQGMHIRDFMPTQIAEFHTQAVYDYLNGSSKAKSKRKIYSTIISAKGTIKSVMILPKLEWLLLDDFLVAGLIVYRQKNKEPLLCTDTAGNIIGANRSAERLTARGMDITGCSVFMMIPGSITLYFPEQSTDFLERYVVGSVPSKLKKSSRFKTLSVNRNQDSVTRRNEDIKRDNEEIFLYQIRIDRSKEGYEILREEYECFLNNTQPIINDPINRGSVGEEQMRREGSFALIEDRRAIEFVENLKQTFKKVFSNSSPLEIFKVRIGFEALDYQNDVSVREVSIRNSKIVGSGVEKFFHLYVNNDKPHLIRILMMLSDGLSTAYQLQRVHQSLNQALSTFQQMKVKISENLEKRIKEELSLYEAPSLSNLEASHFQNKSLSKLKTISHIKMDSLSPNDERAKTRIMNKNSNIDIGNSEGLMNTDQGKLNLLKNTISINPDLSYDDEVKKDMSELSEVTYSINDLKLLGLLDQAAEIKDHLLEYIPPELIPHIISGLNDVKNLSNKQSNIVESRVKSSEGLSDIGNKSKKEQFNNKIDDEMAFNSEEFSEESHKEVSSTPKHNIDKNEAKNQKAVQNDQISSVITGSMRSSSSGGEAIVTRNKIMKSKKKLKYRIFEFIMFSLLAVFLAIKFIFFAKFDSSIQTIFDYEINVNKYANLLRPVSFAYLQAIKAQVVDKLNIDYSVLPDGTAFYTEQIETYKKVFDKSVREISTYVNPHLRTPIDVIKGLPPKNTSIFDLAYTEVILYSNFQNEIAEKVYNFDVELLENIKKISLAIYKALTDAFITEIYLKQTNLDQMYLNFYISYGSNLGICVSVLFFAIMIYKSIFEQTKFVADILLKIEKERYRRAFGQMDKNLSIVERAKREKEGEEGDDLLLNDKDFKKGKFMIKKKHPDQLAANPVKKMEKELFKEKKNEGKELGLKRSTNDNNLLKEKRSGIRTYSSYSGYPQRNSLNLFFKLAIFVIILNVSPIYSLLKEFSFFSDLKNSLESSSTTNLASASMYTVTGFAYDYFLNLAQGLNSSETYMLDSSVYTDSLKNVKDFKSVKDSYLFNMVLTSNICELANEILFPEVGITTPDPDCVFITDSDSNFTVYKGIQKYVENYETILRNIEVSDASTTRSFFESEDFIKLDQLSFHLTITMDYISEHYMNKILLDIGQSRSSSLVLSYTYYSLLVLSTAVYFLVYLPPQVSNWYKLQKVLLILNDDILSNLYLKSYFAQ